MDHGCDQSVGDFGRMRAVPAHRIAQQGVVSFQQHDIFLPHPDARLVLNLHVERHDVPHVHMEVFQKTGRKNKPARREIRPATVFRSILDLHDVHRHAHDHHPLRYLILLEIDPAADASALAEDRRQRIDPARIFE